MKIRTRNWKQTERVLPCSFRVLRVTSCGDGGWGMVLLCLSIRVQCRMPRVGGMRKGPAAPTRQKTCVVGCNDSVGPPNICLMEHMELCTVSLSVMGRIGVPLHPTRLHCTEYSVGSTRTMYLHNVAFVHGSTP